MKEVLYGRGFVQTLWKWYIYNSKTLVHDNNNLLTKQENTYRSPCDMNTQRHLLLENETSGIHRFSFTSFMQPFFAKTDGFLD